MNILIKLKLRANWLIIIFGALIILFCSGCLTWMECKNSEDCPNGYKMWGWRCDGSDYCLEDKLR